MANDHAELPALHVHIHPKALAIGGLQREVTLHRGLKLLALGLPQDGTGHLPHIVG